MATHSSDHTSAEAREALGMLDGDASRLAERLVTPRWYHLVLGGLVALACVAAALPGPASPALIALAVVGFLVLPVVYRRRYGVSVTEPAGPRSRRLLLAFLGVFLAALLAAVGLKLVGLDPAWSLAPAVVAGVLTVVLGRRYDEALRRELAEGGA